MARRTLFAKMLLPSLFVLVLALAATTWEASRFLRRFDLDQTVAELAVDARLMERSLLESLRQKDASRLQVLCKDLGTLTGKRITVILPSGKVLGDSNEDPANMDNHADRPEVREALMGRVGQATRYSHTLHSDWVYVAVPVRIDDQIAGVVRVSKSLASVDQALRSAYVRLAGATALVALIAALISLLIARRIAKPLRSMRAGAERFARGDFTQRLTIPDATEFSELAASMNRMAAQLDERIRTIHRQRDELQAVLASMDEGVLAVDREERIISLNRAAAALFAVTPDAAQGRHIQEVVRNPKLQQCVAATLAHAETVEDDIVLTGVEERFLHVTSTVLRDEHDQAVGALLVASDVTQLRRLERARSDFVANVSHEIRTPVTSIKGYAETLLGGTMQEAGKASHFLEIIARQADRLAALVDDILALSSLERSEQAADVPMEPVRLQGVIDAAVHVCMPRAVEKNIRLVAACEEDLVVQGNPALLEQAIVNLLDNATKYSEPDHEVRITTARSADEATISVQDFGCGIAPEHLMRVFERFYRVDRARSRKLGGTGLGLAIVKHIMNVHGGRIAAESTLGKGSCFTLHLLIQR